MLVRTKLEQRGEFGAKHRQGHLHPSSHLRLLDFGHCTVLPGFSKGRHHLRFEVVLTTDFRSAFGATDDFENNLGFELRCELLVLVHVRAPISDNFNSVKVLSKFWGALHRAQVWTMKTHLSLSLPRVRTVTIRITSSADRWRL